jgi:DNA processing protein
MAGKVPYAAHVRCNHNRIMNQEDWLVLALCPGMTGVRTQALLEQFGSAHAIVGASIKDLRVGGLTEKAANALSRPDEARLRQASDWLAANKTDRQLISIQNPSYPPLLIESGEAPPCLFVEGDATTLCLPQLAIVGSRNATPGGRETARAFAAHLAGAGLTITSGLALGIDSEAHAGAVEGGGTTIAVLGTGPDEIYPRTNESLAARIRQQGALVTEFAPGTPARRDQFPRRNRIISGLSLGVLVVEAGLRSGSLITARYAGNYGREIFAVPGSIHSPLSKGCHRLIKQGAKLVETAGDIVDELGSLAGALAELPDYVATQTAASGGMLHNDPDYAILLESMGNDPVSIERLAGRSGLTAEQLSSMLLILELEGRVYSLPNGCFQQTQDVVSKE